MDELRTAIKKLQNDKTPGHDGIKPEQLKSMGEERQRLLLQIINKTWEFSTMPEDCEKVIVFPIHKRRDTRDCNSYRGILILCTSAKAYEAIFGERLRQKKCQRKHKADLEHFTQDHLFHRTTNYTLHFKTQKWRSTKQREALCWEY